MSGRVRRWFSRVRGIPARLERLEGYALAAPPTVGPAEIDELRHQLLQELHAVADLAHGGVHEQRAAETRLAASLAMLDGAIAEQGRAARVVLDAARRDTATAALVESLGPPPSLQPGLSIFTISWNHAEYLPEAIRSGLEVLDAVPASMAGELLVLDNGSTDRTPEVLRDLAAVDRRVRVVRSPENLGLSRARNVLLHSCNRAHALMLDADNITDPEGTAAVYEVTTRFGAALAYGVLCWRTPDGEHVRLGSANPVTTANIDRLDVDTFSVVDVDVMRRLGGWTLDPELDAFDDQELIRRVAVSGALIGFVPVVAGEYRVTRLGHSRVRGDLRPRRERLDRLYRFSGAGEPAAFVAHPDLGVVWASDAAQQVAPSLVPAPVQVADSLRPTVLVVAPGGVGNLGDDLITEAAVERVRRVMPDHDVELVTDGPMIPVGELGTVAWAGTLREVLEPHAQLIDLTSVDLAVFAGGGNLNSRWRSDLVANRQRLLERLEDAGIAAVATGQGIGPFTSDADLDMVRRLARSFGAIAVRDAHSAQLLATAGDGAAFDILGDDTIGLAPADRQDVDAALAESGMPNGVPFVAFQVRRRDYVGIDDADLDDWATAVDALAAERGAHVLGVSMNWESPSPEPLAFLELSRASARAVPWHLVDRPSEPRVVAGVLGRAHAAVVCSYHAALVALAEGVPTLYAAGADYARQKAEGLRRLAGLPDPFVLTPRTPAAELVPRLDAVRTSLASSPAFHARSHVIDEWLARQISRLNRAAGSERELSVAARA